MNQDFERAWQKLAHEGACDAHGGSEYIRVRQEYFEANQPANRPAKANADKKPLPDAKKT